MQTATVTTRCRHVGLLKTRSIKEHVTNGSSGLQCIAPVRSFCAVVRGQSRSRLPAFNENVPAAAVRGDAELWKGCRTVIRELAGLDFGVQQVALYFAGSLRPPPRWKDVDMARIKAMAVLLTAPGATAQPPEPALDQEALLAVQAMLSDVWRWRRRGGGGGDEESAPPYLLALESLQQVDPASVNIDKVTSSLLDNLDMTDTEKRQMGAAVERVAVMSLGGFSWGAIVAAVLFLGVINFVFLSSGR